MIARMIYTNRNTETVDFITNGPLHDDCVAEADMVYWGWRDWIRRYMPSEFRMTSGVAKGIRSVEARILTAASVANDMDALRRRLVTHNILDPATDQIVLPDALWCADEKGFNDEKLSGAATVCTVGGSQPTGNIGKILRHISVLTAVSASGRAAPPAVVMAGANYHEKWNNLWPEATIDATPRGSFTARTFVVLLAETFIKMIRETMAEQLPADQ
jgi:hypothetical protein